MTHFEITWERPSRFVRIPEFEKQPDGRFCFAWLYFYGSIEKQP